MAHWGKIIIVLGIFLVVIGIIVYFWGNKFNWVGHLPGDIRIEKENFRFYFPITTMIIVSLVVSLLIKLFNKFFH